MRLNRRKTRFQANGTFLSFFANTAIALKRIFLSSFFLYRLLYFLLIPLLYLSYSPHIPLLYPFYYPFTNPLSITYDIRTIYVRYT